VSRHRRRPPEHHGQINGARDVGQRAIGLEPATSLLSEQTGITSYPAAFRQGTTAWQCRAGFELTPTTATVRARCKTRRCSASSRIMCFQNDSLDLGRAFLTPCRWHRCWTSDSMMVLRRAVERLADAIPLLGLVWLLPDPRSLWSVCPSWR
jgi:hypothetical protein